MPLYKLQVSTTKSFADSQCAETNVGNVNSPLQHLVS